MNDSDTVGQDQLQPEKIKPLNSLLNFCVLIEQNTLHGTKREGGYEMINIIRFDNSP